MCMELCLFYPRSKSRFQETKPVPWLNHALRDYHNALYGWPSEMITQLLNCTTQIRRVSPPRISKYPQTSKEIFPFPYGRNILLWHASAKSSNDITSVKSSQTNFKPSGAIHQTSAASFQRDGGTGRDRNFCWDLGGGGRKFSGP